MKLLLTLAALVAMAQSQVFTQECTIVRDNWTRRCPFGKSYYYGPRLYKDQKVTALGYLYPDPKSGDAMVELDRSTIPNASCNGNDCPAPGQEAGPQHTGQIWVEYRHLKGCGGANPHQQRVCQPGSSP